MLDFQLATISLSEGILLAYTVRAGHSGDSKAKSTAGSVTYGIAMCPNRAHFSFVRVIDKNWPNRSTAYELAATIP